MQAGSLMPRGPLQSDYSGQNKSGTMRNWQMQEAKARLSEVVKAAARGGPQQISVHGLPVAVVLSRTDYDRLAGTGESLVAFVRRSPLAGAEDLEFPRDSSTTREVDL